MAAADVTHGRSLVDHGRLLEVLAIEAEALAGAAAHPSRLDSPVPACPGLTIGETVRHVGSVYQLVLGWTRSGQRPRSWQREPGHGRSVGDWMLEGARELIEELAAHEPDEPCASWWEADPTYGFWCRRMAHETTVHRVDVQAAVGEVGAVDDDIAVDGVDEVLTLWFTHRLRLLGVSGTRDGTVAVRAGEQAWITRAGADGTETCRADQDAVVSTDAEVAGSPARVFRWLWGRAPDREVRREGDYDAVAQLWALLRLATR